MNYVDNIHVDSYKGEKMGSGTLEQEHRQH